MRTSITEDPYEPPVQTISARCTFYREKYAFPAAVDLTGTHILMPIGGLLGALTMPDELGRRVLRGLHIRMLSGPVIERPQAQQWTFITGPNCLQNDIALAHLLGLCVSIVPRGHNIFLPSPREERLGLRRWELTPSASSDVPPQQAVIATTRAMSIPTAL